MKLMKLLEIVSVMDIKEVYKSKGLRSRSFLIRKQEVSVNEQLAEELRKPVIKKN